MAHETDYTLNAAGIARTDSQDRDAFEAGLQQRVRGFLEATIVNAIKARTGAYSRALHEAILRNLLERFTRDKGPLLTHFTGLKELPPDDDSSTQRLVAFEQILNHYLPGVLCEEVPLFGDERVRTEKLNVI